MLRLRCEWPEEVGAGPAARWPVANGSRSRQDHGARTGSIACADTSRMGEEPPLAPTADEAARQTAEEAS